MQITLYTLLLTFLWALSAASAQQDASSLRGGDRLLKKKSGAFPACMQACTSAKEVCEAADPTNLQCGIDFKACKKLCV